MTGRLFCVKPAPAAALVLAIVAATSPVTAAVPDESLVNKVVELNKKALARYEALDMEGAARFLREAIEVCKNGNLERSTVAARTHLHLGVVYVSGLKHRELGLAEFHKALAIDPAMRMTNSLSNPEVEAAFAEAQTVTPLQSTGGRALPFPTGQEAPGASAPTLTEETVFHPPVALAVRDRPVSIKAQVPPGSGATKVVLAYRAEHGDEFLARDMVPVEHTTSWYRADIPAAAAHGNWVVYYIEARRDDDQLVAHSGTADEPHRVALAVEPIAEDKRAGKAGKESSRTDTQTSPGLWFLLAAGTGGGYHQGSPEMNPHDANVPPNDLRVSGFGAAQAFHLAPEIGYFQTDHFILSAQGRLQFVGGAQDVTIRDPEGQLRTFRAARMAFAGFLKATWLVHTLSRRVHPLLFAQIGGGQIRHTVETPGSANLSDCNDNGRCRDTVLGGLLLAGGGIGATYSLVEHIGLYGAVTLLAGIPHIMVEADINVGAALTY
jgi:hypothetical protein